MIITKEEFKELQSAIDGGLGVEYLEWLNAKYCKLHLDGMLYSLTRTDQFCNLLFKLGLSFRITDATED